MFGVPENGFAIAVHPEWQTERIAHTQPGRERQVLTRVRQTASNSMVFREVFAHTLKT